MQAIISGDPRASFCQFCRLFAGGTDATAENDRVNVSRRPRQTDPAPEIFAEIPVYDLVCQQYWETNEDSFGTAL